MKNLKFLLITLCAVFVAQAAVISAASTAQEWGQEYAWEVYSQSKPSQKCGNDITVTKDSLVAVDTLILLNKYALSPGYEYFFNVYDSTGTVDSIKFEITTHSFGMNKSSSRNACVLYQGMVDSIGGGLTKKAGIAIPDGTTRYGGGITLKAIKWIGTVKAIIWRFELLRRRSISQTKTSF